MQPRRERLGALEAPHARPRRSAPRRAWSVAQPPGGSRVTSTARSPLGSEPSQNVDRPRLVFSAPLLPPGRERRRRTAREVAVGTDWAIRIMHVGRAAGRGALRSRPAPGRRARTRPARRGRRRRGSAAASATRLTLQRWSEMRRRGRGERPELGDQVAAVLLHHRPQLRRAGDAAGGGERLGDLVGREQAQGPVVDPLAVGPHGEDEHHVGQVDGLPPRRRSHLRERHVDEQQLAVADQQVGRLDVAVGQAGVPEPAHEQQSLVDDGRRRPSASPISLAPSKNSVTSRYSRSGVISTIP